MRNYSNERVQLHEVGPRDLETLGIIPIAFEVTSIFDVAERSESRERFVLSERDVESPYVKDYDAIKGEGPRRWQRRFDISTWGFFLAYLDEQPVGGCAIAFNCPETEMLEGRDDLAVLWDIRVMPAQRGFGIGQKLLRAAEEWARNRRCTEMKIETQNVNVPACHFYAKNGYCLSAINRRAYTETPDEIQMLWSKSL